MDFWGGVLLWRDVLCTSECQCGRMFYIARSEVQGERERGSVGGGRGSRRRRRRFMLKTFEEQLFPVTPDGAAI